MFTLLTGETQESLYEGRLFTCTVVGIVRRKPQREVLDRANPVQDEHSRLWKCPFCLKNDFRDIGMVSALNLLGGGEEVEQHIGVVSAQFVRGGVQKEVGCVVDFVRVEEWRMHSQ